MRQSFFSRFALPIVAVILLVTAIVFSLTRPPTKKTHPPLPAPVASFPASIAGIGVIEPSGGYIQISSEATGVVKSISVNTGQIVHKGDILFKLDNQLTSEEKKLTEIKLANAEKALKDIKAESAVSKLVRNEAEGKVNELHGQIDIINTKLNQFTVRSPINGMILKIDIHEGEIVQGGITKAMIIGKVDHLSWVRVEVDASEKANFKTNAKAVGILRGETKEIPLTYLRSEPEVTPKSSLSNQGDELIDARVIQMIYTFNNEEVKANFGQEMDVFIQSD